MSGDFYWINLEGWYEEQKHWVLTKNDLLVFHVNQQITQPR